jgi:hypothetical protein
MQKYNWLAFVCLFILTSTSAFADGQNSNGFGHSFDAPYTGEARASGVTASYNGAELVLDFRDPVLTYHSDDSPLVATLDRFSLKKKGGVPMGQRPVEDGSAFVALTAGTQIYWASGPLYRLQLKCDGGSGSSVRCSARMSPSDASRYSEGNFVVIVKSNMFEGWEDGSWFNTDTLHYAGGITSHSVNEAEGARRGYVSAVPGERIGYLVLGGDGGERGSLRQPTNQEQTRQNDCHDCTPVPAEFAGAEIISDADTGKNSGGEHVTKRRTP